jgi:hypothetical protein
MVLEFVSCEYLYCRNVLSFGLNGLSLCNENQDNLHKIRSLGSNFDFKIHNSLGSNCSGGMDSQILRTGRLIIEVRFCLSDVFLFFSRESSVVSVCFVTLIFFVDGDVVIRHQALPKDEEDENGLDSGSD